MNWHNFFLALQAGGGLLIIIAVVCVACMAASWIGEFIWNPLWSATVSTLTFFAILILAVAIVAGVLG